MIAPPKELTRFRVQRQRLSNMLGQAQEVLGRLGLHAWLKTSQHLKDRIDNELFKVLVLGEFKRGKSTFINALLGREILPSYARPCTAVICEIKYAEQPHAILHFRHPLPNPLPERLPVPVREAIRLAGRDPIPPMRIPVEHLRDYVTISDPARDHAQSVAETPYERVELFYPLEFCKEDVVIVDAPGLNEHGIRTRVTLDYLTQADAIVFVISCTSPLSLGEMQFLDGPIRGSGHQDLFVICNRYDEIRPREREELRQYLCDRLRDRTTLGDRGIHFVSSLNALDGMLDGKQELVNGSGIPEFETALTRFLAHDRGKVKLLQPARHLGLGLHEALFKSIPAQLQMLESSEEDLRRRYQEIQPRLAAAEEEQRNLLSRVERGRLHLRDEVRLAALAHFRELADTIPELGGEIDISATINALKFWDVKKQIGRVSEEIVQKLAPLVETRTVTWQKKTLEKLIEKRLEDILEDMLLPLRGFFERVEQIRIDLSTSSGESQEMRNQAGNIEKVLAAVGGFFLAPGATVGGITGGFRGMARGLAIDLVAILAMVAIGMTNPITILGLLFAGHAFERWFAGGSLVKTVKEDTLNAIKTEMQKSSTDNAETLANRIHDATANLQRAVSDELGRRIQSVREEVQAALQVLEQGQIEVQNRRQELRELQTQLQGLYEGLTQMMQDLAAPHTAA